MKWVHRRAINILRPSSWTIFHARNHGTILFLKLCNLIIENIKKTLFFKNKKKLQTSRAKNNTPKFARQDPRGEGGVDAGAHESPPKIDLETKIRGGNKWSPKINWNKKQMLNNTIPQPLSTHKKGRGRLRPRPSLYVFSPWGIVLFSICFLFQWIFGDHLLPS